MTHTQPPVLSIVVPCYNEELVLEKTSEKLLSNLHRLITEKKIAYSSFICFIDDGSKDRSWEILNQLNQTNPFIKAIKLSRNFGQQSALFCGLLSIKDKCDCALSLDANLQDDPEIIDDFLEQYSQGFEIVYGIRKNRATETTFKKYSTAAYYKILHAFNKNIVHNHTDYRLLSKNVLEQLNNFKESNLFVHGLIPHIGYKSTRIYYDKQQRLADNTKYSIRKLFGFAIDSLVSSSIKPLRLLTFLGLLLIIPSTVFGIYILFSYINSQHVFPTWLYIMVAVYFLGGLQLFGLGLVGEYVGKIHHESQARPRFIVETALL